MNPIIIAAIVLGSLLFLLMIAVLVMNHIYSNLFSRRADGSESIIYTHPSEFNELNIRHGYISTRKKYKISYYVYKKDNIKIKATLLVIHGVGFGHFYSLPLIKKFCDDGYLVIAYDQFASGASEGRAIKSLTLGLKEIKPVLEFIESDSELSKYPLYTFGHSWGGYISFSALRYSNDIKKSVSVAGFTNEGGLAPKFSLFIKLRNFFYAGFDAFYDNRKSLRKTTAECLYIQGEEDKVVNPVFAGKKYLKIAQNHKNINVKMLPKKGHVPFNDDISQAKQDKVMSEFGLMGGVLVPIDHLVDFRTMCDVDEKVYQMIIDFYNN